MKKGKDVHPEHQYKQHQHLHERVILHCLDYQFNFMIKYIFTFVRRINKQNAVVCIIIKFKKNRHHCHFKTCSKQVIKKKEVIYKGLENK